MVPVEYKERLSFLLNFQLKNKGTARFGSEGLQIRYDVKGTRASGDMNTSSGNCMIMVSLVYSYMSTLGINWRLANNGDDCVLMIERKDYHLLSTLDSWF